MIPNFTHLPKDLPVPVDDGAASHLEGSLLPDLALEGTDGTSVNLANLPGRWVISGLRGTPRDPAPRINASHRGSVSSMSVIEKGPPEP